MDTASAVLSSLDLLHRILCGNVGATTFVMASRVCKGWREATTGTGGSKAVLLSVASYTNGLTKGEFVGLLALTSDEADATPHERRRRASGGAYHLYSPLSCEAAIAKRGDIHGWRLRLNLRRLDEPRRRKRPWEWNGGRSVCRPIASKCEREERIHHMSVPRGATALTIV